MVKNLDYNVIVQLAADTPAKLRAVEEDIIRVFEEANNQNCFYEFKKWLLEQDLQPITRQVVERVQLEITIA